MGEPSLESEHYDLIFRVPCPARTHPTDSSCLSSQTNWFKYACYMHLFLQAQIIVTWRNKCSSHAVPPQFLWASPKENLRRQMWPGWTLFPTLQPPQGCNASSQSSSINLNPPPPQLHPASDPNLEESEPLAIISSHSGGLWHAHSCLKQVNHLSSTHTRPAAMVYKQSHLL